MNSREEFLLIRFSEQRASALLMSILTGLSVFFTHILGVCIFPPSNTMFEISLK